MSSVTYKNVAKKFGDQTIIKNLNIKVEDKEFLVLVGPSGCGKTTALRLLAGLEEVTEGEIIIGDRIVNDVAPKDRDIAMVFQSYALYPHLSVYDNLAFGLKLGFLVPHFFKRCLCFGKFVDLELHFLDLGRTNNPPSVHILFINLINYHNFVIHAQILLIINPPGDGLFALLN